MPRAPDSVLPNLPDRVDLDLELEVLGELYGDLNVGFAVTRKQTALALGRGLL